MNIPKQYTLEYSATKKNQWAQGEKAKEKRLNTKAVEGAAGTLECVDDIKSGNSLSLGVLSVCHRVANDLKIRVSIKLL